MKMAGLYSLLPAFLQTRLDRVLTSSVGGRLLRGAFWSFLGTILSKVCSTISWVVVGRMIGKESFGELNMLQNTVGMFGAAAGLGMGMAATKYVAEYRAKEPDRAGRFIGLASLATWLMSGVLAISLVFLAPWLARETLEAPHLSAYLMVSSLLLFFSGIAGAQQGTLAGLEAFKDIAVINVIIGVTSFPLLLVGAVVNGVGGALWALIATAVLNCLLNYYYVRKQTAANRIVVNYRGCMSERSVFWDFNLPGMLNTLFSAVVVWAVGALLVRHSNDFGGLGIYNAVQRIKLIPENLAAMLLAPMLPVLSETLARGEMASYGRTLQVCFTIASLTIIPLALIQISAPWVTMLPYGAEYDGGTDVVLWTMLHTISYAILWPMGNILVSMGRIWFAFVVGSIHNVLTLTFSWFLVPRLGAAGLPLATSISFVIACVPCVVLLEKTFPNLLRQARWGRMTLLVIMLMFVCGAAERGLHPVSALLVGVFAAIVFVLWRGHPSTNRQLSAA